MEFSEVMLRGKCVTLNKLVGEEWPKTNDLNLNIMREQKKESNNKHKEGNFQLGIEIIN